MVKLTVEEAYAYCNDPTTDKSPKALEDLADSLLADEFNDMCKSKVSKTEYPVLSSRQQQRRADREIPFSSLSKGAKTVLGIPSDERGE